MLKITEMSKSEMNELLVRVGFGHLGCTRDGHPYVVPMNYVYDRRTLYFLTTEGTKTEYMAANSEVCFQVEEISDPSHWRSVMLFGKARRVTDLDDLEYATKLLTESNPSLKPAINRTDVGAWHRLNVATVYGVRPEAIYGRQTV